MAIVASDDDEPANYVDAWGDPVSPRSERDLRAWRRCIGHLTDRGLTPIGVQRDVVDALYGLDDANLRRVLDMWGAA